MSGMSTRREFARMGRAESRKEKKNPVPKIVPWKTKPADPRNVSRKERDVDGRAEGRKKERKTVMWGEKRDGWNKREKKIFV